MKTNLRSRSTSGVRRSTLRSAFRVSAFAVFAAFLAASSPSVLAADATWNSPNKGSWATGANPPWSTGAAPGASSGTTNADTATFNLSGSGTSVITVDAARNIKNMTFSTTSGVDNFLFTGGALQLTSGGTIQTDTSYTGAADFNTGLTLNGGYTLNASGAVGSALNFGAITTSANLTTATLVLAGTNTGLFNTVQGVISQGSNTTLSLSKTGAGTWVVANANTYTGGTTLNGGTLITNNAASLGSSGTITVAGNSTLRTSAALTDPSARISISDGATLVFDTNNTAQTWAGVLGNSGGSNTAGLTKTGLNTLTITPAAGAVQTWKGATTVNMGTLTISGASQTGNFTNLINSSSALVLGGGAINFTGKASFTNSQAFNGTTLNAGISPFIPAASTGTNTIDFGAITRNSGSLLYITTAGSYTFNATGTSNDAGGAIKGVIYNGDFSKITTNTLGAASYTTQNAAGSWTSNTTNYQTGGAVTGATASGAVINALKLNNASSQNVTITDTLTVNDGVLFGSSIGANGSQISGGTLTAGSGDLIIVNNNAQSTFGRNTITSALVDNGGGATNVVLYSSAQNGILFLGGTNTYTGNTYIGGGANAQTGTTGVTVGGAVGARIGSPGATVYLNGGTGGSTNVLRVGNGDATGDVLGTIQVDNGNLQLNRTDTSTLSATVAGVAGGGYITIANTGNTAVNLASGSNTFQLLQSTAAGTLNLAGAGSMNTFISTAPFNGTFVAGSTTNFQSGTYIFGGTGNTGNNRTGTWNIQGATVQIQGGRYFNSGGGTLAVSSGTVQFGGDRITAGEQQGSGTAINFNVSGSGLLDVGMGSGGGFILGSNGAVSQDATSSVTGNQTGGTVQVGVNAPLANSGSSTNNFLTIGNGVSQVQASYKLSGGTLRVAGTIQGAAVGAAQTGQLAFTSGNNTATMAANNTHYVGEVLSGVNATAAGVNGAIITAISTTAPYNVTLNMTANATLAAAPVTGQQQAANLSRTFNWTGGTLTAGAINMTNLGSNDGVNSTPVNGGGTLYQGGSTSVLAPGDTFAGILYTGKTAITGNYAIDGGAVAIGIGGTTAATVFHNTSTGTYDNISVSAATVLGGRLSPALNNGYTPPNNTTTLYNILVGSSSGVTGNFLNQQVATSGNSRVVLADGLSSFLIAVNNTASAATTGGLTSVAARTVALGGYQSGNTYSGTGTAWDTASAGAWSNFDPGATSAPASQASGAIAQFADGTASTGAIGVSLNSSRNIQGIQFSSSAGSRAYTISDGGSGAVILDNTANGASATISDSSTSGTTNAISVPITLNSNLSVSVADAANTLNIGGAISGTGKALTKSGLGALTLTAANSYTGNTTVTAGSLVLSGGGSLAGTTQVDVNGGSLIVGTTNAINDAAGVTMNGGTLEMAIAGGGNETLGALTLSSNSTLDFSALAGNTLTFAGINNPAVDVLLNLTNWGLGDHLYFSSNATLSASNFTVNGGAASLSEFQPGFGYEIVAVPEPGTMSVGVALAFALAFSERKRLRRFLGGRAG